MTAETSNARGEWPERYACNGPEGTFWTDDAALAHKLIGAAFDRDEWTVTDTQNPTGAAPPPSAPVGVEGLVRDLVCEIERNTCTHEETHRGGALWEICDLCGAKWADDRGGKPEFQWPDCVERAHEWLAQQPAAVDEAMVFRLAVWMAKQEGHDDPHYLIWEGSPPEPWGEVWKRYEDDARSALTAALAGQQQGGRDDG